MLFNKSSQIVSVTLSDNSLKLVHFRGSGPQAKIVNLLCEDISQVSAGDLPRFIQSKVNELGVKNATFVAIVPSGIVTTKNIEVPSVNAEEIKSIVNLQASRHTPFSRDEIEIGYVDLGVYKTHYSKVLLVIANKNTLKEQISILEKGGIRVEKVLFAPEGTAAFYAQMLNKKSEEIPCAVIDIGSDSSDFVIILKEKVISSRNIAIGRNQLAMDKAQFESLRDEIVDTLDSYQNEDIGSIPNQFILTSQDNVTESLRSVLQEKLKGEIEVVPYVDQIKVDSKALQRIATDFENVSFLDVVSPIIQMKDMNINLVPEDIMLQKSIANQGKEIFKCAVYGFIFLMLIASGIGVKIYFRNSYLTKLENKFRNDREAVEYLENKSNQTRIIQGYLRQRMVSLDVINELYRNIPSPIYLIGISMDEEGNISIQGISDIASLVFNLGSALKDSDLFQSVEIKSTTAKKDRGKDVSAFEIALKLKGANTDTNNQQDAEENP